MAQMLKNLPAMQKTQVDPSWEDPLEKEMAMHSGENSMDRRAWQAAVHGVTKSGTWLSD